MRSLYLRPAIGTKSIDPMTLLEGSEDEIVGDISEGNAGGKNSTIWNWMEE